MGFVQGEAIDAVEHLIRSEYARLVRAVALSCGSLPLAEDAVQDAFGQAWERASRDELPDQLAAWVVTVALNRTRSTWRRDRRLHPLSDDQVRPGGRSGRGDDHGQDLNAELLDLRHAVAGLPRRQREVVVLHYYLGYEVARIASLLGVSEGNVKNALFRARVSLAAVLRVDEEVTE